MARPPQPRSAPGRVIPGILPKQKAYVVYYAISKLMLCKWKRQNVIGVAVKSELHKKSPLV